MNIISIRNLYHTSCIKMASKLVLISLQSKGSYNIKSNQNFHNFLGEIIRTIIDNLIIKLSLTNVINHLHKSNTKQPIKPFCPCKQCLRILLLIALNANLMYVIKILNDSISTIITSSIPPKSRFPFMFAPSWQQHFFFSGPT